MSFGTPALNAIAIMYPHRFAVVQPLTEAAFMLNVLPVTVMLRLPQMQLSQ